MRLVPAVVCGVLVLANGASAPAQASRPTPVPKRAAEQVAARSLADDEIEKLVKQLESDPDGAMPALGKAGMRGLRAAAAQLTNPNPTVRGRVAFHLGYYGDVNGARLSAGDRGWLAATLLEAAAKERSSEARNGALSGLYALTGSNFSLGAIPDSVEKALRGATRAWAESFAEAVGRGAPHARTSLDNPDKDAIIASGDVFKRFGPYLQESGDVLLQVLRDSARATRHTDDALLAAATKGAGALPDTIVATIVVELLEGREDARRDVGENLDTTMMAALHAMAGAGKAGLTTLIALTDALSPQAQFAVLDGRQQASGVANPRAFGYARDNGRADRDHERAAVIDALGAACRTRPTEAPGIAEALTRLAFDSTGDVPRGAQVGSKSRSPRYDTHIPSAYAARIAAIDALPSCGPAARGAVNGLIALANRGDIGASNGERELLAAAGRAAAAIQRSK